MQSSIHLRGCSVIFSYNSYISCDRQYISEVVLSCFLITLIFQYVLHLFQTVPDPARVDAALQHRPQGHPQQVHPQSALQQRNKGVFLQRLQQVHGGEEESDVLSSPQPDLHQEVLQCPSAHQVFQVRPKI